MTRTHFTIPCEGETIAATLDDADGTAGLLWVSGGNELRSGAFAGQAQLAALVAAQGWPVLRFDRRGVGDSSGENRGFRMSAPDIAAALAAFKARCPALERVVGFGNCDAASALMLAEGAGCDGLVLANPWTIESDEGQLPPAAIRARYAAKLRNPREWGRLVGGQVSWRKLLGGLRRAAAQTLPPSSLAQEMAAGLVAFRGPVRILLAGRDRTALAFQHAWSPADTRVQTCPSASHAFVESDARSWLLAQLVGALADEQAGELDVR